MYMLLLVAHILITVLLVGAVLIQSGRGAATANIFGGARAAENVFGASTPAVLNNVTATLATAFIVTSIALTLISGDMRRSVVQRYMRQAPPATETAPDGAYRDDGPEREPAPAVEQPADPPPATIAPELP